MKSWKQPTNEMIDKALQSTKKGTARKYFFSRLENPLWLQPLTERGCFQSPPSVMRFDDNSIQFPSWPEFQYLKNVSRDLPDEVINLILGLPKVDNPSVYNDILEIALQLHGGQSAQLKPKILEYTEIILEFSDVDLWLWTHKYADLLAHWTAENQTSAALEFTKVLVEFAPNPQSETKQKRRGENPTSWGISLQPLPRIAPEEYAEIMSKGIRLLAEKEPYQLVRLLIDTTANMIHLGTHQKDPNKEEDASELWCERLSESDSNYEDPKTTLVHTLTFVCEQVYEKSPDSIVALDEILRNQQWKVFKRLRQHLYAQYPNEQTKPWIRELILGHEDYNRWEHHYEFQQMIRSACDHFGTSLLTEAEQVQIFDTILGGPSKTNFQRWRGDEFTEEDFEQRQRNFHRKQFKPFQSLLFGEYKTYFQELETTVENPISDEDYQPLKTTKIGYVSNRSPRASEGLAKLTDEELLSYINEWEGKERFYEGDSFVDINIEGLAEAFQTVFKDTIIPDANRLRFWIENRERIARPIYVRMMINGMQAEIKEKNFDRLNEWLIFSEWVLSHTDRDDYGLSDESRENPNWHNSRRAVGDFIGVCLEEDVDVPLSVREQLARLLEMLCTQFDSWLDRGKRVLLNRNDPLTEGINNTRSYALQALVKFGSWLRRHDSESEGLEVTMILEKRFALQTKYPLTPPEYAILGSNYPWIFYFNKMWAAAHKSDFFLQDVLPAWLAAFVSYICYSEPFKPTFEILKNDFDFALQHLVDFNKQDIPPREEPIDILGQHLFHYYLWEMYPLRGSASENDRCALLEQFYQRTDGDRECWANLFNYVGRILRNTGEQLDKDLKDRTIAFFDWRFEIKEPRELRQFTHWLEAKCLEAEWRLDAYSKILDVCKAEGISIAREVDALCELLPDHTTKVLECFVKLTNESRNDNIYIRAEEAKTILKAGLENSDESVRQNAERAHENLLREGRFDLLDLND